MKNFEIDGLTELSRKEMTTVQGGGVITDILTNIGNVVSNLPGKVAEVGDNLKKLIDFLF